MGSLNVRKCASAGALFARRSSFSSVVAAEIAEAASQRSPRLVALPPCLLASLAKLFAESNRKNVRLRGLHLTDKLKYLSRSRHRGGVHPNFNDVPNTAPPLRGKRRQLERRALADLSSLQPLATDDEEFPSTGYWGGEEHRPLKVLHGTQREAEQAAEAAGTSNGALYDDEAALAYAVTRLSACYAALEHVLRQVRRLAPNDWYPSSLLDFGAGPATAAWAALEVWPSSPPHMHSVQTQSSYMGVGISDSYDGPAESSAPTSSSSPPTSTCGNNGTMKRNQLHVAAIDPSSNMTWLGQRLMEHLRNDLQAQSGVPQGDHQHYKGGSIANTLETSLHLGNAGVAPPPRIVWSSKLPALHRGSIGKKYDLVVAAYVLGELKSDAERRRTIDNLWRRTDGYLVLIEPGTPAGFGHIHGARTQVLNAFSETSHVAAPCPHDGQCPLVHRKSWCHFSQRFERPAVLRSAKQALGGNNAAAARPYQDERFSYVVLAKGARPSPPAEVAVAGAYRGDVESLNGEEDNAGGQDDLLDTSEGTSHVRNPPKDWKPNDFSRDIPDNQKLTRKSKRINTPILLQDEPGAMDGLDLSEAAEAAAELRRLLHESVCEGDEGGGVDGSGALSAEVHATLQELLADAEAMLDVAQSPHTVEGSEGESSAAATFGLGVDAEAAHDGASQTSDALLHEGPWSDAPDDERSVIAQARDNFSTVPLQGADDEAARSSALAASKVWSRLLRPPLKRSGHVTLDVCSAHDARGRYLGGKKGVLLRQVVSRGAVLRETGGTAGYRMARKARWGDCWPLYYQKTLGTTFDSR